MLSSNVYMQKQQQQENLSIRNAGQINGNDIQSRLKGILWHSPKKRKGNNIQLEDKNPAEDKEPECVVAKK